MAESGIEMELSTQPSSLSDLLISLETVPWFSAIGNPMLEVPGVFRINDWDEWPGPEDEDIMELSLRQQALYDEIMGQGDPTESLKRTWDQIHEAVFRRATSMVPYNPSQDAWHGPTMAVWQAAWTAGLVGLCLASGRSIPDDLQRQWQWFLRGHWPCGYESFPDDSQPGLLLVF